jgi:hypothetical protein
MTGRHPFFHRRLLEYGWTHRLTGGGHHRYTPPPGHPHLNAITVAASPSDHRGIRNALADFRRAGFDLTKEQP